MKLALIDLNSAYIPIYEATKNDPVDNAHDICVEKIRRIADTADHVAVCIDSPPYDRTRLYAAYKAPRAPTAFLSAASTWAGTSIDTDPCAVQPLSRAASRAASFAIGRNVTFAQAAAWPQ